MNLKQRDKQPGGLRQCLLAISTAVALLASPGIVVGSSEAISRGHDDVSVLMRVAGINLDIDELSSQMIQEIEAELNHPPLDESISDAAREATVKAARTAFAVDRLTEVVHTVLTERLLSDDTLKRIEAHSTDFGRRLIAIEFTEKRRAEGEEYQAFLTDFMGNAEMQWRRSLITDMYRRHDVAAAQAQMYVDVQTAVLVGMSSALPHVDKASVAAATEVMRAKQLDIATHFEEAGIAFTGWLYRDLGDEEFERAVTFNDSPDARRVHAALMDAYREAVVSGGLIYGGEVIKEQQLAESYTEI